MDLVLGVCPATSPQDISDILVTPPKGAPPSLPSVAHNLHKRLGVAVARLERLSLRAATTTHATEATGPKKAHPARIPWGLEQLA